MKWIQSASKEVIVSMDTVNLPHLATKASLPVRWRFGNGALVRSFLINHR